MPDAVRIDSETPNGDGATAFSHMFRAPLAFASGGDGAQSGLQVLPNAADLCIKILATDFDQVVASKAREGLSSENSAMMRTFIRTRPSQDPEIEICSETGAVGDFEML